MAQKVNELDVLLPPNRFQDVHMTKEVFRTLHTIVLNDQVALVFTFNNQQGSFSVRAESVQHPNGAVLAAPAVTIFCHTATGNHMLALPPDTPIASLRAEIQKRVKFEPCLRVGDRDLLDEVNGVTTTLKTAGIQMGEVICVHSSSDWVEHSCAPHADLARKRQNLGKHTFHCEGALRRRKLVLGRQRMLVCIGLVWDSVGPFIALSIKFTRKYRGQVLIPLAKLVALSMDTVPVATRWRFTGPQAERDRCTISDCASPPTWVEDAQANYMFYVEKQKVASLTPDTGARCSFLACQNLAVESSTRCHLHIVPVNEVRFLSQCVSLSQDQIKLIFDGCEFLADAAVAPIDSKARRPPGWVSTTQLQNQHSRGGALGASVTAASVQAASKAATASSTAAQTAAKGKMGAPVSVTAAITAVSVTPNPGGKPLKELKEREQKAAKPERTSSDPSDRAVSPAREQSPDSARGSDSPGGTLERASSFGEDDAEVDTEEAEEPESADPWAQYRANAELKIAGATQGSNFEMYKDEVKSPSLQRDSEVKTPSSPPSPKPKPRTASRDGVSISALVATGATPPSPTAAMRGSNADVATSITTAVSTTTVTTSPATGTTTLATTTTTTTTTQGAPLPTTALEALAMYHMHSLHALVISAYTLMVCSNSKSNQRAMEGLIKAFERIGADKVDVSSKWMRFFTKLMNIRQDLVVDEPVAGQSLEVVAIDSTGRTRLLSPAGELMLKNFAQSIMISPDVDDDDDSASSGSTGGVFESRFKDHKLGHVTFFHNGSEYFKALSASLLASTKLIAILGWELNPYIRLNPHVPDSLTLGELLKMKAVFGCKVIIQLWKPPSIKEVACGRIAKEFFEGSKVICRLAVAAASIGALTKSHHQKMILCDGGDENWVGYTGGIDVTKGRWDTEDHSLGPRAENERYNSECSTVGEDLGVWPQQPWHDVHCRVRGPVLEDFWTNFQDRWRFASKKTLKVPLFGDFLSDTKLNNDLSIRVLRSFHSKVRGIFEQDIRLAYLDLIERAKQFIYIETQFFIDNHSVNHKGIKCNPIPKKLCERIKLAIAENPNTTFCVVVLIPMYPEGNPLDNVAAGPILFLQWQTIMQCYARVAACCVGPASHRQPDDFLKFVTLGRCDSKFAPSSGTAPGSVSLSAKASALNASKRYMIYVHAKTMVVDDCEMIIGSANMNERSMAGDRDTEMCLLIKQLTNQAGKDTVTRFRNQLWENHLRIRKPPAASSSSSSSEQKGTLPVQDEKSEVAGIWKTPWDPETRYLLDRRLDYNWRRFRGAQEMNGLMPYPLKFESTTFGCEPCVLPDCEHGTAAGQWSPILKEFGLYG